MYSKNHPHQSYPIQSQLENIWGITTTSLQHNIEN